MDVTGVSVLPGLSKDLLRIKLRLSFALVKDAVFFLLQKGASRLPKSFVSEKDVVVVHFDS